MTSIGFISEVCEDERKMFDSLLELDFMTLSNQNRFGLNEAAAINEATEEKVKLNIVERAKDLWRRFVEWVKLSFEKFKEKINQIMKNTDIKLVNKYQTLMATNWDYFEKDFPGLKNFDKVDMSVSVDNMKGVFNELEKFNIVNLRKNYTAENNYGVPNIISKEEKFVPDRTYISKACKELISTNSLIDKIEASVKNLIKTTQNAVNNTAKLQKEAEKNKDEKKIADLKESYERLSEELKIHTSQLSIVLNLNNRRIQSHRRCVFVCGSYTTKMKNAKDRETNKAKHESVTNIDKLDDEIEVEEAYAFANMIGLASDAFCENVFESDEY